jgi:hypothetical protein
LLSAQTETVIGVEQVFVVEQEEDRAPLLVQAGVEVTCGRQSTYRERRMRPGRGVGSRSRRR